MPRSQLPGTRCGSAHTDTGRHWWWWDCHLHKRSMMGWCRYTVEYNVQPHGPRKCWSTKRWSQHHCSGSKHWLWVWLVGFTSYRQKTGKSDHPATVRNLFGFLSLSRLKNTELNCANWNFCVWILDVMTGFLRLFYGTLPLSEISKHFCFYDRGEIG